MAILTVCPSCRAQSEADDALRGRRVRCTRCGTVFEVGAGAHPSGAPSTAPPAVYEHTAARRPARRRPRREDDERPPRRTGRGPLVALAVCGAALAIGVVLLLVGLLSGGRDGGGGVSLPPPVDVASLPPLPAAQQLEPGVVVHELSLRHGNLTRQVWIYLPEHPARPKVPCVLVAPAGTPLIWGNNMDPGYRDEHLPYVRAGFAVIAYSIDGDLDDAQRRNPTAVRAAASAFKDAAAGLANERLALDYALARVPAIDGTRVFTAGHSSAATLSLLVAENDPRVTGCVAYAPITNLLKRLPAGTVDDLDRQIPGFRRFIVESSPHTHVDRLRCPVFLFHAEDDSNEPIARSAEFVDELKRFNQNVTFYRARRGNHYNSMIREGIPHAIRWMRQQAGP
jgi:predicted Zn finger-like uncharacterized protein